MKNIVLKVDGMMCSGCENRIQNALKSIDGVENVKADHITKTVIIISKNEISENTLKDIIEDIGYDVIE